mgnify:CR=1 FL=1
MISVAAIRSPWLSSPSIVRSETESRSKTGRATPLKPLESPAPLVMRADATPQTGLGHVERAALRDLPGRQVRPAQGDGARRLDVQVQVMPAAHEGAGPRQVPWQNEQPAMWLSVPVFLPL